MAELKSLVDRDSKGNKNDDLETAIALNVDDYSQQPIFSKLSLPCITRILNKSTSISPELATRIIRQIYIKNKADVIDILKIIKIDGSYSEFINRIKEFTSDVDNIDLWTTINRGNTFSFTRDYSIITSKCQKDLEIINYNKSFYVNSFMASRCSQYIFSRVIEDISINKIYTEIDSSIIQYFIDYLNGNYREYTSNIDYNFIKAVVFFKIQSLLGISVCKYFKNISISEKMNTLHYIFKNGMNISNILQFALEDYVKFTNIVYKLSSEALNDIDFIAQILQNPFIYHKPEKIAKFILERIRVDHNAVKLLKYCPEIDFQNQEINEILKDENFNLNYLRKSLISQNCSIC